MTVLKEQILQPILQECFPEHQLRRSQMNLEQRLIECLVSVRFTSYMFYHRSLQKFTINVNFHVYLGNLMSSYFFHSLSHNECLHIQGDENDIHYNILLLCYYILSCLSRSMVHFLYGVFITFSHMTLHNGNFSDKLMNLPSFHV